MMNTLRHDARSGGRHDNEAKRSEGSRVSGPRDWVFAFHDGDALDLQGISLLLTARTLAESEDRQIWLAGLPREFWYFMEIMGLEGLFLPFPELQPGEA
jgi:hypothetical protein